MPETDVADRFFPWGTPVDGRGCRTASQVLKAVTREPEIRLEAATDILCACQDKWFEDGVRSLVGETDPVDIWADYAKTVLVFRDDLGQPWKLRPDAVGQVGDWVLRPPSFRQPTFEAWVITAWNPHSVQASGPDNELSNEHMIREIDAAGLRFTPAKGQSDDGSWSEDSFLVHDPDPEWLVELAARYGQNAVFRWNRESWSVVGVLLDGTVTIGWSVVR